MSRDYKNIKKNKKETQAKNSGNLFSFLMGTVLGIFVTSAFFFNYSENTYSKKPELDIATSDKQENRKPETTRPEIEFEFPTILEKREISKIPEKKYNEPEIIVNENKSYEIYILQVGSFKSYKSADALKAKLAFSGLISYIEKKDIIGKGISYRVLVGPYEDEKNLKKARKILSNNNVKSVTFKQTIESKSM